MKLLAIDIGNTHINIGLYADKTYLGDWRIATGVHRTEDELMTYISHFISQHQVTPDDVYTMAIASVVPNVTQIFLRLGDKYFRQNPFVIDSTLDLGISIDYNPPEAVGADRLCNAVAAYQKFGGPNIIVDLGTATTLDVISKEGVYLGGAIAPGIETAAWGLHNKAAKLPNISLEFPEKVIGKSTEASMQAGIMIGTIELIDGLIALIQEELQEEAVVIATGGLSKVLASRSRFIKFVETHLVLDGIVRIFYRNQTGAADNVKKNI